MGRVLAEGLRDWGTIPGWVIPKTRKKKGVLDASLRNEKHYKVLSRVSGAVQGKEYCFPLHLSKVAIEKMSLWVTLDYGQPTYLFLFDP